LEPKNRNLNSHLYTYFDRLFSLKIFIGKSIRETIICLEKALFSFKIARNINPWLNGHPEVDLTPVSSVIALKIAKTSNLRTWWIDSFCRAAACPYAKIPNLWCFYCKVMT